MAELGELFKKLRDNPEQLSEEELKQLMAANTDGGTEEPPPEKPQEKPRVTLEDGSVLEAESWEQLSKDLSARLGEHRAVPDKPEAPQPGVPPAPPKFDMDEFTKRFVKDAREGMEYLETAQYGFPVSRAVPVIAMTMKALADSVQEIQAQRFLDSNDDYVPTPENQKILEGIVTKRGWKPGYQSLNDAFAVAKTQGLIKPKEKKQPEQSQEAPFIPPRSNRSALNTSEEDLHQTATDMPLDKLENLLVQAGFLKSKRY